MVTASPRRLRAPEGRFPPKIRTLPFHVYSLGLHKHQHAQTHTHCYTNPPSYTHTNTQTHTRVYPHTLTFTHTQPVTRVNTYVASYFSALTLSRRRPAPWALCRQIADCLLRRRRRRRRAGRPRGNARSSRSSAAAPAKDGRPIAYVASATRRDRPRTTV